jgi:hypothetical protein
MRVHKILSLNDRKFNAKAQRSKGAEKQKPALSPRLLAGPILTRQKAKGKGREGKRQKAKVVETGAGLQVAGGRFASGNLRLFTHYALRTTQFATRNSHF